MTDFHDYLDSLIRGDALEEKSMLAAKRESFTFPTAKSQWTPPRQYNIDLLTVDWNVDIGNERVDAISKLKMTAIVPKLSKVFLHALDLTISGITDSSEEQLEFDMDPDSESMMVYLSKELTQGEVEELTFAYTIERPRVGLWFTNPCPEFPKIESSFWTQMQDDCARACVPVYDNPSHKFPTETILTVPDGYYAMSNGFLKERKKNDDGTETFHWVQELPIPGYLMTMAASEYVEYKEDLDGLEVSFYAHKKWDRETVYRSFGKTPDMIKFFEQKLGVKYPWAKYAQITAANFVIGGMENTSATTQTDITLHEEKVHKDYQSDWLVAHELAHMWGGDLVTCRTWSHGWLNEGWGTQMQNEWKLHDLGYDEYLYDQYGKQTSYFDEDKNHYRRPIVYNEWERGSDMFDRHLYPGAAWRYYMLKHLVGEDEWWKILGEWMTRFAHKSPYTHDLEALFTEMTGEDYGWFFEQWLYKAGYPECKIECSHDDKLGHALVKIEQTQKHDDGMTPKVFKFPLTVEFVSEDGERIRYNMQVNERVHSFYYPVAKKPKQILVDPDYAVLMDWNITKPEMMWIEQLYRGKTVMQRIKAAQALGKKANPKSLEALGKALLDDQFWGVQAQIAKVLGSVRNESALGYLMKGYDLKDSRARTDVARALGNFYQNDKALSTLETLLKDQDSYFVVASAATSIGKLRHSKSLEILKDGIKTAPETWTEIVKSGYLSGLKETGKEEAIPIIKEYVKPGHDDYLRRITPGLLAILGKKYKKKHPEVKEIIEGLFHDKSYKVQLNAINAAKGYGDASLIGSLTKLAEGHVDADIVRLARLSIRTLSKKKDSTEVDSIRKSVEELEKENRDLKDRLSKVESLLEKDEK
ncbi:MAG: M1 family aminopeptidase [Candidatus Thorarchaeota archaeon]|jgi:aminopeptidase N